MKVIVFLSLLALVGFAATSWYAIKIDWMYTSSTGKLWFDVYDGDS